MPWLKKQGGFIVNTSSIAARNGAGGGAGLYGSAKAFVSNVTRGMAKELIGFGIRVNAVAPGAIPTPFHERYSTAEQMKGMVATIPQGRAGTARGLRRRLSVPVVRPAERLHHRPGDRGEWRPVDALAQPGSILEHPAAGVGAPRHTGEFEKVGAGRQHPHRAAGEHEARLWCADLQAPVGFARRMHDRREKLSGGDLIALVLPTA